MREKRGSTTPKPVDQSSAEQSRQLILEPWLTEKLRDAYDEIANEPLPPSLLALLDELEKSEGDKS